MVRVEVQSDWRANKEFIEMKAMLKELISNSHKGHAVDKGVVAFCRPKSS